MGQQSANGQTLQASSKPLINALVAADRMALDVLAAGSGAAITDSIFNPLAMITVRQQVDWERRMYHGLLPSLRRVLAEEGLLGLWAPGLVATWLRAFSQTGLRIGLYPRIKRLYHGESPDSLAAKIGAGATTGSMAAAMANPADLVRVRLQADAGRILEGCYVSGLRAGHEPRYAHTFKAFQDIFRKEGVIGLWNGVQANVARAALLSAGQLSTYDQTKQVALQAGWVDGPRLHLASSCLSGFVAQVACMPADVVKTRMQTATSEGAASSALEILREGPRGFYRGFVPAASRQVPVMAVQMPIVEYIRKHIFGLEYL
ncbi:unnamed protein product [Effrenium voratum]|nr:unnamed protein product [Effrenium voratum]